MNVRKEMQKNREKKKREKNLAKITHDDSQQEKKKN